VVEAKNAPIGPFLAVRHYRLTLRSGVLTMKCVVNSGPCFILMVLEQLGW
jgi:hypothetical protein